MTDHLQTRADLDLNEECRALWRGVAISYASDGVHMERMAEWADRAVADYRKRFAKEFDFSSRDVDHSAKEKLHGKLFAALLTTSYTLVTIPVGELDDPSALSLEVHVPSGVTIDMFINKLATTLYGHGLLNVVPGQVSYKTKEVSGGRQYCIADKYSMKSVRLMKGTTVLDDSSIRIATKADVLNVYRLDIKL